MSNPTNVLSASDLNLLFIFTDQQKLETLACYGNDTISMPNLNALADRSVVFDQPYCVQPVCTPSRGTLMTGLLPHEHGAVNNNLYMNDGVRCLPELLPADKRDRYKTAYMGKWHLGDEIFQQHGFDEWVSIEDGYYPYYTEERDKHSRSSYYHFLRDNGFMPRYEFTEYVAFSRIFSACLPERYGKPHFLANEACRFIRDNSESPWMLTVNFLEPHTPYQSPRNDQYDPDSIELPESFEDKPGPGQPAYLHQTYEKLLQSYNGEIKDPAEMRAIIARYWGLNSLVDTHVGRILDTLADSGQKKRTVIVFTSDHGDMMGAHGLLHKSIMYKESTRVPLMIHLPDQSEHGRITGPVSHIDLVPTLMELLGVESPDVFFKGCSLADLCREAASGQTVSAVDRASPCVVEWNPGKQFAKAFLRTLITPEGERYTHADNGEHEYYDLRNDPHENENLESSSKHSGRIKELREQLAAWQKRVCDTAPPIINS